MSTLNTKVDITFNHSWYLIMAIPLFLLSMELRLFPFRLKFMCLNGVAVEVQWENFKFSPIDFFYFCYIEIWNGSPLVQLHWLLNGCVMNFFWPCSLQIYFCFVYSQINIYLFLFRLHLLPLLLPSDTLATYWWKYVVFLWQNGLPMRLLN
jgi:hypothetical protein